MSSPSPKRERGARSAPSLPAVLFDLDGTLIDSLELLVRAMEHAFTALSLPLPRVDEWVSTIGRPLVWQFGLYARGEEEIQRLVQVYRAFQHEHHDRLTRAFDGIPALVAHLDGAGHPLGVVTSKGDHLANRSLHHVGLARHFGVVVGADRTARHKPDPDPIHFALEALGAATERAVYIGDSPFDVMAANAAGITSIAVTWGASSPAALAQASPAHVVSTVPELQSLLAKLHPPLPA